MTYHLTAYSGAQSRLVMKTMTTDCVQAAKLIERNWHNMGYVVDLKLG